MMRETLPHIRGALLADTRRVMNSPDHPLASPGSSTNALFKLVYDELRSIACARMQWEREDHTLSATALVNEAYLRLSSTEEAVWDNRGHFFAAAAEAMRRVLIDRARAKRCIKRSGIRLEVDLDSLTSLESNSELLQQFDDALSLLEGEDPTAATFVKLRVYTGLNNTEAGAHLGLSQWASYRMWDFVRAWFSTWERADGGV